MLHFYIDGMYQPWQYFYNSHILYMFREYVVFKQPWLVAYKHIDFTYIQEVWDQFYLKIVSHFVDDFFSACEYSWLSLWAEI